MRAQIDAASAPTPRATSASSTTRARSSTRATRSSRRRRSLRFADMLRVAPDLMRLRADRSVYASVARFVKDERTRQALSFHSLLVGGNPFETSTIYTLIHYLERKWGVFFPRGGTGALVQALVRLFTELGGELRLSCPVQRVRVRARRAQRARRSTAGRQRASRSTWSSPIPTCTTPTQALRRRARAQRPAQEAARKPTGRCRCSCSISAPTRYDDLAHHTVVFGPRYRELLQDVFQGPRCPTTSACTCTRPG